MSHSVAPPRRTWPWVVIVVVAVIAIVGGVSLASAMLRGDEPEDAATSPVVTAAASATPTPTVSATPSASPTETAPTEVDVEAVQQAIDDNDPTELYDYLADPVHITFAASDFDSDRARDTAITDLAYVDGATGWNWQLDDATLAAYRAGTYRNYFPDDAIIGQSAEGYVIAFTVTGPEITRVFVSKSATIVTAPVAPTATP